ncbi:MAG: PEGA domain-containing protein [Chitinispirillaceae bacterium]|nr:PEGA domain-containing protein [Chitinispirillaceae bacterium]
MSIPSSARARPPEKQRMEIRPSGTPVSARTVRRFVYLMIAAAGAFSCSTNMGIQPAADAGRGSLFVLEKNNLPARVFLDYRTTGLVTPATIENVPAGRHTLHLFYPNFQANPAVHTVEVMHRRSTEVRFELQRAAAGSLAVETAPDGAMVSLNAVDVGSAPLSLSGMPSGTYVVGARLNNYRSSDTVIVVSASLTAQARMVLEPVRSVVIEYFSNVSCPGCPIVGTAVDRLLEGLPQFKDMVNKISFHANFPASNDPFYQAVPGEQMERVGYYGIPTLPSVRINGGVVRFSDEKTFIAQATGAIEAALSQRGAPELSFDAVRRDSLAASGTVSITQGVDGAGLFVALVEDFFGFDAPPGNNGQKYFHAVFRGFSPEARGLEVTGREQRVVFTFDCSAYAGRDLSVIAFLQVIATREIVQSLKINLLQE